MMHYSRNKDVKTNKNCMDHFYTTSNIISVRLLLLLFIEETITNDYNIIMVMSPVQSEKYIAAKATKKA
jgi:hypothetical protein